MQKKFFSINVQKVNSPFDFISNIVARWPGSTHESCIFENSSLYSDLEAGRYGNGLLLGDEGYPCRKYFMTKLHQHHTQTRAERRYNSALTTANRQFNVYIRTMEEEIPL